MPEEKAKQEQAKQAIMLAYRYRRAMEGIRFSCRRILGCRYQGTHRQ